MAPNSRKYNHLFFDLDHTLWDFESNSEAALRELFESHNLAAKGVDSFDKFLSVYHHHNNHYWKAYRNGNTQVAELRIERFVKALSSFRVHNRQLAQQLSDEYLALCPTKQKLLPGARDMLDFLAGHYQMHIITNGFHEVQMTKLHSAGMMHYFDMVLTGDKARALKPNPGIFHQSLEITGAAIRESIYIGDSLEVDIMGAQNAGWDHVFCNHDNIDHDMEVTYEVKSLLDLKKIFPVN